MWKRMLSVLLAAALLAGPAMRRGESAQAASDGCKVIDISTADVFVENTENQLQITVGSVYYSGDFQVTVYDGGTERQKIYEGSGTVDEYDWEQGMYGSTVVSVPITGRARGIVQYDILLTYNGITVHNRTTLRVYGAGEVTQGLLVTGQPDKYRDMCKLLKQKGVQITVANAPDAERVRQAGLVIVGTDQLQNVSDAVLNEMGKANVLLVHNSAENERANQVLSSSGSQLRYAQEEALAGDLTTQEYGNCVKYGIISTELNKDSQIKNLYFHMYDVIPVLTQQADRAETVLKANSDADALVVEQLPAGNKIAVTGGDFFCDAELAFSSDNQYEQLFSSSSYQPANQWTVSNYHVASNLLDWLLPQPVYRDMDIQTVKNSEDTPGMFVSITGTVVTPSESIAANGTAFQDCIYLQDDTGGIRVFGINSDATYAYRTWKINVKGFVSSYGGEREVVVFDQTRDISEISRKDHSVEPQDITAAQIKQDSLVGNLVRMTGTVSAASAGRIKIEDETGAADALIGQDIGSSAGSWPVGSYDPRMTYGCTAEVTGVLSKQDGENVLRIFDTANIVLLYDAEGNPAEPPEQRVYRHFGGGLKEVPQQQDITINIGNEAKEFTPYMKALADLSVIDAASLPGKALPAGSVFSKMLQGCHLQVQGTSEDSLTVRSAAIQVLSALGYRYFFNGSDGAAQQELYLQQTGILDGITADRRSILTAGDAARMVYNALTIPFFGEETLSADGSKHYQVLDQCILDQFQLTLANGVILQTHYTDVQGTLPLRTVQMRYEAQKLENGQIRYIAGEDLFYSEQDLTALVGMQVTVFVADGDGHDRHITAVLPGTQNTVYQLPVSDYAGFENGSIKHLDEAGKIGKLPVDQNAQLYVNGIFTGGVTAESLTQPYVTQNKLTYVYGTYTIIDHNRDGNADVVLAEVYRDYIVNAVDKQTFRIDDKLSDVAYSFYLDPNAGQDVHVAYQFSGGGTATFDDIEKGDVLSVCISKMEGRNILWGKVVITKGSISGKISAVDKGRMQLELNGVWYPYIEIDDLRQDDFLFNLGDEGKFFVNMQGIVIMKDLKSMPYYHYAFVIAYGMVREQLDEIPAMCVYLPDEHWESYYFAQNVTVRDGGFSETLKREDLVERYLKDSATGELTLHTRTLVNFALNEENEIATISFPSNNNTGKNDKGRLTLDRKYNQPNGDNIPEEAVTQVYDGKLKRIGDAFLTEQTLVFDVTLNEGESLGEVADIQERIHMIPVSSLRDGSAPVISLFDMGDGNECAAAITVNAVRSANAADPVFVVNNVTNLLDASGNTAIAVYGYQQGEVKRLILDETAEVTHFLTGKPELLGSGDVILYHQNTAQRVTDAQIILNVGMANHYLPDIYGNGSLLLHSVHFYSDESNPRQKIDYYYGLVTEKHATQPYAKLVLARDNTPNPSTLLDKLKVTSMVVTDENTVFYRVDQQGRRALTLSALDDCITATAGSYGIRDGDMALVKTVNGVATDVIFISPETDGYR